MIKPEKIQLHESWLRKLQTEFEQDYMCKLREFLRTRYQHQAVIYPPGKLFFNALNSTPFEHVRVVILGQDPYHGPGQAHGLSFSVPPGVRIPPSLVNIYREIAADVGTSVPQHGCLQCWAEQGVLLLNSVLSVERGQPGSHQGKGWERFTDAIVRSLNDGRQNLVFLLWGNYAVKKGAVIDQHKHLVLTAPHPSPLSAHRGFFGCRHFSASNRYLLEHGQTAIDWSVPDL